MYEIGEEEIQAVANVIRSRQLFRYRGGEQGECAQFERELCAKLGCGYALAVNSGTSGLICALAACGIGPGDEVLVPAFTFMATALAVLAVGAVPVMAEVDESLTMDPVRAEARMTPRTKAIIVVHMFGLPCAMDQFLALASKHGARLIEDSCQAVGGSYRGRRLGTIGDAGALSFNQFKIITAGEGGALLTGDRALYERALLQHDDGCVFRNHVPRLSVPLFTGANYRTSEITGAILRVQLTRLDSILAALRERKRALLAIFEGSTAFRLAPVNCPEGDCGVAAFLQFENEARMRRVLAALLARGLPAATPADSSGHVYTHWKPVLGQQGAHHPKRNAFQLTDVRYDYSPEMCPASLDVLSRTIGIPVDYNESVENASRRAERVRRAAERI